MDNKSKMLLIASLLLNVLVVGFWGVIYFKGQKVSDNKATITYEEQKTQELNVADDLQVKNFEQAVEKEQQIAEEPKKEETQEKREEKKEDDSYIKLSGKTTSSGVSLSWNAGGLGSFDGFKIVKSKDPNPVYPGSDYQYISDKDARSYSWKIDSGSKYHFRVCKYSGGKCLLYSNDVYLDTPEKGGDDDDEYASSVSLSLTSDGDDKYLKWSISGGEAPKGYKVVKSKDKNPEYPEDGYYKYISDGDTKKVKLEGFDSDDEYHFRVCIYKGGSCGAYSNDVEVSF